MSAPFVLKVREPGETEFKPVASSPSAGELLQAMLDIEIRAGSGVAISRVGDHGICLDELRAEAALEQLAKQGIQGYVVRHGGGRCSVVIGLDSLTRIVEMLELLSRLRGQDLIGGQSYADAGTRRSS